ncbi:MAG TPA: DUF1415 family protein [Polyangiales bacterium]|nr:DUF1415 family protein [Polyangiales bacterium]
MFDWQALEREALRLHARYTIEVVEALGLCPWAADARRAGRVHTHVSRCDSAERALATSLEALQALAQNSDIDVAFIVYPLLDLDRLAFAHFVAELRAADAQRYAVGETVLALADFHPNAAPDPASAERLVPFLRRTPDLTLQIVRRSALNAVRMSEDQGTSFVDLSQFPLDKLTTTPPPPPPLAARVANNNLRTVTRMGTSGLSECLESILADRHASYFELGLPLPLWKAHT